jgi:DNA mismatch repair protein MutH
MNIGIKLHSNGKNNHKTILLKVKELDIKERFDYDHTDEESIMERARMLKGKTIGFVEEHSPYTKENINKKNKGKIGNYIQKNWFGIPVNNSPEPDFEEAGIELKACPIIYKKTKGFETDQRTKICVINYMALYRENWENSHAKKKLNKILFVFHERQESHEEMFDKKILDVALWELSKEQQIKVIENDWQIAFNKNYEGKSHELTETLFKILTTSGATGGETINGEKYQVEQPVKDFKPYAKLRAFSLRWNFTNQFWLEHTKPNSFESITSSLELSSSDNYELVLVNAISKYEGKTMGEIANMFNTSIPGGKAAVPSIIKLAIGFKSVKSKIKEFEQLGILVKTFPVRSSDMRPWEAVSFPAFKIKEFTEEIWEESTFLNQIGKIMFVPFSAEKSDTKAKDKKLNKPFFWSPNSDEIELIKYEWEAYKAQASKKLNIFKKPGKYKKGYKEIITNLSNESETKIIHIRPHGRDSDDRDEDHFGTSVVKQSFWLNKDFLQKILIRSLND